MFSVMYQLFVTCVADVSPASDTKSKSPNKSPSKHAAGSSKKSRAPSAASSAAASPEVTAISKEFAEFLNRRVDKAGVADVSRQIKMVVDKIKSVMGSSSTESVEELSTSIQEFYLNFQKRLETKQQFHGKSIQATSFCTTSFNIHFVT